MITAGPVVSSRPKFSTFLIHEVEGLCGGRCLTNQDAVGVGESPTRTLYLAPTGGVWKPSYEWRKKRLFVFCHWTLHCNSPACATFMSWGKNSALGRSLSCFTRRSVTAVRSFLKLCRASCFSPTVVKLQSANHRRSSDSSQTHSDVKWLLKFDTSTTD